MTEAAADRTGEAESGSRSPEPERLDMVLRRLGFVPDTEDRLRRLELAVGTISQSFARELEGRAEDRERIEALEKAVGAKAVGRQKRKRREW